MQDSQSQPATIDGLQQQIEELTQLVRPPPAPPPVVLDAPLIAAFLQFSASQGISKRWRTYQRIYLTWWSEQLGDTNLRAVSLPGQILPALDGCSGARGHRIAAIKRLYSWLRSERHQLGPAEDPTLGTLKVPQSTPAQWKKPKAFTRAQYRRLHRYVDEYWQDPVCVLGGTGWHYSELERFIRAGELRRRGGKHVLECPQSKRGPPIRTYVSADVAAAGRRLLKRGRISYKSFRLQLIKAAGAAGISTRPGYFRHSVATHAVDSGDDMGAVSDFLNHTSKQTMARFYATHAVPAKVKTLH